MDKFEKYKNCKQVDLTPTWESVGHIYLAAIEELAQKGRSALKLQRQYTKMPS